MLVSTLISSSLRKIGALSSGEVLGTTRQAEALQALQSMLRSWGAMGNVVFATIKESTTLVAVQSLYTWGVGGNITSTRPNKVLGAYIVDAGGTTHPVSIMSEQQYSGLTAKTTVSRPNSLLFHASYPLANIYLYPVPDTAETLWIDSIKPFAETSSFGLSTDTIAFPGFYEEAIIYNLAIRLAPEYGRAVSAEVATVAEKALNILSIFNASNKVSPVFIHIPANGANGARYSINSDSYV
ncbi:MAG: hypothetical protein WCY09_08520 [Candidatus Omnitrophota bacterium]